MSDSRSPFEPSEAPSGRHSVENAAGSVSAGTPVSHATPASAPAASAAGIASNFQGSQSLARGTHAAQNGEPAQFGQAGQPASPAGLNSLGVDFSDRSLVIGRDGRWIAGWAWRFVVMVAAGFLIWKGLGALWVGLLPVLLAILVSTVLWPPVNWMRNHKFPNALAAALGILGFFAIFGGVVAAIAPSIASQSRELFEQARKGVDHLISWAQGEPLNLQVDQFNGVVDELTAKLQAHSSNIASGVFAGFSTASSVAVTLAVTLVLTFFFLKDGPTFLPFVRRHTGPTAGWHLSEVLTRTWNTLAGFIRAQAAVSLIDAIFIGIGLILLKVPLALALATITFFAGFIPIIGAVSAGTLAVLIALVSNGPGVALAVLALIIVVQQVEGHVLSPMLQSKAMDLHPVIVLLSITVGGTLFGIVGAFLAVPVAAAIAVWLRYHADLVSLRTGELTVEDIEIATAKGDSSNEGKKRADAIRGKLRILGKNSPEQSASPEKAAQ